MSLSPVMSKTSSEANGTLNSPLRKRAAHDYRFFANLLKLDEPEYCSNSMLSTTYEWRLDCLTQNEKSGLIKDDMLRIQRSAQDGSIVFNLSGRIEMDNIGELKNVLGLEPEKKRLVLDLKEITLVDRDAVLFLGSCEVDQVKLKNCPGYIREWITRERQNG